MKATQFEYRFRLWISFLIYVLGFWAPWLRYGSSATPFSTTRLEIAGKLSHWLPLDSTSIAITAVAILLAAVAAALRVWGTAETAAPTGRSESFVAERPQRGSVPRQYFGSLLFALAVAIFMPPSGAALCLALTVAQVWRLTLSDETIPLQSTANSRWTRAIAAEVFYVAMTVCLAVLAWRYDPTLLIQALLICFGFSLVARAFIAQAA